MDLFHVFHHDQIIRQNRSHTHKLRIHHFNRDMFPNHKHKRVKINHHHHLIFLWEFEYLINQQMSKLYQTKQDYLKCLLMLIYIVFIYLIHYLS